MLISFDVVVVASVVTDIMLLDGSIFFSPINILHTFFFFSIDSSIYDSATEDDLELVII